MYKSGTRPSIHVSGRLLYSTDFLPHIMAFRFRLRILVKCVSIFLVVVIGLNTYKLSARRHEKDINDVRMVDGYNQRVVRVDGSQHVRKGTQWRSVPRNISRIRTRGGITRQDILVPYEPVGDKPSDIPASQWFARFKPVHLSVNLDVEVRILDLNSGAPFTLSTQRPSSLYG
jgi:hypothetical protein